MDENKTFNISMPKSLLDAIDKQAESEFRNRSDLIREATRTYISSRGGMSTADKLTIEEEKRIKDGLNFAELSSEPAIVVSCSFRRQPNSVKDIFHADSEAVKLMENPGQLRYAGWDLTTLDHAKPIAGDYLEVTNGKRKLLRLYRDGQIVFSAGLHFFGHAVNKNAEEPAAFNLLSVAEFITNFAIFANQISETLELAPDTMIFSIVVSNPSSQESPEKSSVTVQAYDGFGIEKVGEFNSPWAERNIVIRKGDNMSAERISYLIYAEFSHFFGIRGDELWYVNKEKREINKSDFRA